MSRILSKMLAACLLLSAFGVLAQPITRVYRADSRPPHEIFDTGFQGRGANMDLLAHTLGGSCEETDPARASTWVSTSARRETATGFAMGHLEGIPGSGPQHAMYIYTIRADHTYVDVRGVMRRVVAAGHAGQQGYDAAQARTLEHLLYTTVIGGEEEVVAHHVAPANIFSAERVFFDASDDFIEEPAVFNTRYRPLDTEASDVVADLQVFVPAASIRVGYDSGSDSDSNSSCSMTCDGAGVQSRSQHAAASPSAQSKVRRGFTPLLIDIIND
ncbi:hypothetical protein AB4059_11845 [Lysobacter sp. 2RAF19]